MNCDELNEIDEEIEAIEAELKKRYAEIVSTLIWERYSSGYSFRRARYGDKTFYINCNINADSNSKFTLSLVWRDENNFEEVKFLGRFISPEIAMKVAQTFIRLKGQKKPK